MRRYLWCFPGLGKSSLHLEGVSVVDADCEQFKFQDVALEELHGPNSDKSYESDEDYPNNYLRFIQSIEADVVLLNCHIGLCERLNKEDVLLVYPDLSLVPEYLQRYRERGDNSSFISYMEKEAEGMLRYIEASDFEKYRVVLPGTFLSDLFERNDFKVKVMNRVVLAEHIQKAKDLNIIGLSEDGKRLECGAQFLEDSSVYGIYAEDLADAVFNGKYELDLDQLLNACIEREGELKKHRLELISHFQRAIDLNVLDTDKAHNAIVCDLAFVKDDIAAVEVHDAYDLADAVMNGKYEVDIDNLLEVCKQRELQIEEMKFAELRGGLSREELADKIMQGIVNGALGIEYDQIAPYSHGYEVTFGGKGPVGSTRDFKNRWECYCNFFDIPGQIVAKIEADRQSGRVFGKKAEPFDIHEMLRAIEEMEGKQISAFIPEKETDFERWGSRGYGSRGSIATVMDVHAGKGLNGIVQHHYHGDYSSMTPVSQNNLVETLVYLKGFCLDCLTGLDIGPQGRQSVIDYLKKHGTDVSTPEKLQSWCRQNPEKCAREENREYFAHLERDKQVYEHAYCDFIQLSSLANSHAGSLEAFCETQDIDGHWYEDVYECCYGVLYVKLFEKEDGSISVSEEPIDIWDPERDNYLFGCESFSRLKEKCQELGLDLKKMEAKALAEISNNRVDLDEQIREASAGQIDGCRETADKSINKER